MRTRLCTALFVVCVAAVALVAQRPQPSPNQPQATFRGGTNYVRVDMYATLKGVAVDDLKPEEIELREDGVLQKIETFEHVVVRGGSPESSRVEPSSVSISRQMAADARARVFVIFLDTLHTQIEGSAKMRTPLVRFLDRLVGEDDLVAVMTPDMSASDLTFGRKTTVISNMLEKEWAWGQRGRIMNNDKREDLYDYCYPPPPTVSNASPSPAVEMKARRREKLTFDALEDLVTVLTGLREERKAVLTISEGWIEFPRNDSLAAALKDASGNPTVPPPDLGVPRQLANRGREDGDAGGRAQCEADRLALAHMDDTHRLQEIGQEANRGNVSFYTVYPRGLAVFDAPIGPDAPPPPSVDAANLRQREQTLRFLAETTDGMAIVDTNYIEKGIDRIVSDLTSYYLLSYYSTNTKTDGRFRSIGVRALRPGIEIRARRGYRAPTSSELRTIRSNTPAPETSETAKAMNSAVVDPNATFRMRAASWTTNTAAGSGGGHMWLVGELDARARRQLAWTAGAQAQVTITAPDGSTVTSKTLDMPAADGVFAISVPDDGNMAPGDYAVRVRVRPQSEQAAPINEVTRVHVASASSSIGEAVVWRRGPTTGPKYVMTADPRFTRTERIRLELPTRGTTMATATLLDRSGKATSVPLQVTDRADPAGDFRWIVIDGALAPLAPGDYAIEVALGDERQVIAFKIVP